MPQMFWCQCYLPWWCFLSWASISFEVFDERTPLLKIYVIGNPPDSTSYHIIVNPPSIGFMFRQSLMCVWSSRSMLLLWTVSPRLTTSANFSVQRIRLLQPERFPENGSSRLAQCIRSGALGLTLGNIFKAIRPEYWTVCRRLWLLASESR